MRAALVTSFDAPPAPAEVAEPTAHGPDEFVVEVLAAGLHPRVRSQADGSHYTGRDQLPLVPGIDGVGRDLDGTLRYFVLPDTRLGSMAERTVVDPRRSVVLPADADPVTVAAAMNPAMSSWVALRRRVAMAPGQSVLVLGATGNAGRLAIDVARQLGAGHVVAVGRGAERLDGLGADVTVDLDAPDAAAALGVVASEVVVVLDYVWGQPTADALRAVVPARRHDDQQLSWVQIGSVAGLESPIPSAALRATRLQLVGSGQGSVSTRDIVAELGELATVVASGVLHVDGRAVPLDEVGSAWTTRTTERIVVTP